MLMSGTLLLVLAACLCWYTSFAGAFVVPPRSRAPSRCSTTTSCFVVVDNGSSDNDQRRSVSDYMGGHHAGKFDFDTRICGVTALNYEKSVIVFDQEESYAQQQPNNKNNRVAPPPDELPSWAAKMETALDADSMVVQGDVSSSSTFGQEVTIRNEELTWEPFYARVQKNPSDDGSMMVSPASGTLAPRGGRNGFSDSCQLRLQQQQENKSASVNSS